MIATVLPGPRGGLTSQEAQERLRQHGPNAVPEERPHPVLLFLQKFWAPVPWMLELTLVLELVLGKYTQTIIIVLLLLLNATLSFVQESRALRDLDAAQIPDCGVFAGVLPEDKYRLVQALQRVGHTVGMTGDGVNDAPALKQAEVGIAVANATDVAKAAASLVLTRPGLGDVLAAVETGRQIYQRLLTYTLNKIIKTFQIALFLSLGLLLTGVFVTTPRLILLLLFANDFVTMSLAADRVAFSRRPDRWQVRPLVLSALMLALAWLVFSFAVFLVGRNVLHLDLPHLQTLVFAMLVFTGQATVYLVRERRAFWSSLPGSLLAASSIVDVIVVALLATQGILMPAISWRAILGLLSLVIAYLIVLDVVKVRLFRRLELY